MSQPQPQIPSSQPSQIAARREEGPFYLGWAIVIADIVLLILFLWVLLIRIGGGGISFDLFKSKPEQVIEAFKAAGLPASNPKIQSKADLERQGQNTTLILGDVQAVQFDVVAGDRAGTVVTFSRDDDYQRFKQLFGIFAPLAGAGNANTGKQLITSFRDGDKMLFSVNAAITDAQASRYKEVFLNA